MTPALSDIHSELVFRRPYCDLVERHRSQCQGFNVAAGPAASGHPQAPAIMKPVFPNPPTGPRIVAHHVPVSTSIEPRNQRSCLAGTQRGPVDGHDKSLHGTSHMVEIDVAA